MKSYILIIPFILFSIVTLAAEKKIIGFDRNNFNYMGKAENVENIVRYPATDGSEWQLILLSRENVLKRGGQYIVEFKVKVMGEFDMDKKFEFVVRNRKGYIQQGDVVLLNKFADYHDFQQVRLRFDVPQGNDDYSMYFYVRPNTGVELKDFVLKENDFLREFHVRRGENPAFVNFGKLPTGSPEFEVLQPAPKNNIVVNAADFGVSESSEANASALVKAIAYCKKVGAAKLVLKRGRYKCYEENVPIKFFDMNDFTFDGGESTFVFRRKSLTGSFSMYNSNRIKIRNFKVDWDWDIDPLAAVVKITNEGTSSKDGHFFDVEYSEFANAVYPLYGKPTRAASMSPYDFKNKTIGEENGQEATFGFRGWDKGPKTEWLDKNIMRIYAPIGPKKIGKYYRLQHFYYEDYAFMFGRCEHVTFEKITVLSCRGAAFYGIADNKYIQMIRVNVKPPTLNRRPITSTCDHFYIHCPKGYIKLINCEFSGGGDDCFNVHGPVAFGKKIGDTTLQLIFPTGIEFFTKGSTIELCDAKFTPLNLSAKIKSVKTVDNTHRIYNIELDKKLPVEKNGGFVLFNPEYCIGNVIIRDCYFHDNRARGLLLLSHDITVENCRFKHNEMAALRFETGYAFGVWSEGVRSENIVVRNCEFDSPNSTGMELDGYESSIVMRAFIKSYPSSEQSDHPVVRDILFENNTFRNSFGLIANIVSAQNVIFRSNTFIDTLPRNFEKDYRACFYIRDSSDIKIVNNTWIESPCAVAPRIIVDSSSSEIVVKGNRIVSEGGRGNAEK